MADEETNSISPPYISFRTFYNLIERLAESGIPQYIDRSYWRPFLSGSLGPQVMAALRFFVLIIGADNEPTTELERLVEDKEQRKQIFAEMLKKHYAPVFDDVDLARTTTGHLERTFNKNYKLSAETRRKAITFFLHAAQYAGFSLSTQLKDASRTRSTVTKSSNHSTPKKSQPSATNSTPTREASRPKQAETPFDPFKMIRGESTKTITLRSGGEISLVCTVDWIGIDQADRKFVFSLIDRLKDYEQENLEGDVEEEEEMMEEEEEVLE
jgi:hypothetical protein